MRPPFVATTWLARIACVLLALCLAQSARADAVFPARTGRVVDQASLLSQSTRDRLTALLAEHERNTTNQVVVVTVRSLQGMRVEAYALALANRWGVGQSGRNNGVLLLVAPTERSVRIEVGTGLERTLTNRIAADIIDNRMLPAFRTGRYEAGIDQGVNGILAAIGNAYEFVEQAPSRQSDNPFTIDGKDLFVGVLMIGVAAVAAIWKRFAGGELGDSGDSDWGHSSDHSSGGGSFSGGGASGHW